MAGLSYDVWPDSPTCSQSSLNTHSLLHKPTCNQSPMQNGSPENICSSNEDTFKNRTVPRVAEVQQSACCCVKTINNSSSSILKLLTPRHLWDPPWDASTACRCTLCLTPLQKQLEIPFGANGVDLINENDGGRVLLGYPEELSHQLGPVSQVLLDQLRAHHTQEGGWSLVGHSFGEQRLACM